MKNRILISIRNCDRKVTKYFDEVFDKVFDNICRKLLLIILSPIWLPIAFVIISDVWWNNNLSLKETIKNEWGE